MEVTSTSISDVKLIKPNKHGDSRGFFSEVYNRKVLQNDEIDLDFVQDNHSMSQGRGTLRGLHYQAPPFAQWKLVRVLRGSIYDVAVDIRSGSPTFGQHVGLTLSAEEWTQILVPVGFAHGFCTLEAGTEVFYKVTNYYSSEHDFGIRWNDPALGIKWPVGDASVVLSDKDRLQPLMSEISSPF